MKKTIISFLVFALSITLAFLLTACAEKENVPECNHAYVRETIAPTCTENGFDKFSCTKCDHYFTMQINATGHSPEAAVEENRTEATCPAEGHYDSVVYCGKCDDELSRETVNIPASVHNHLNNICTGCGEVVSSEGLEYTLNPDEKSYTVTGIGGFTGNELFIGLYNGLPVTSIGYEALYNCSNLTSVTIGNGVTNIGERAFFSCDSLTSVTIGNSVTSIGEKAFSFCDSLTSITIPDSVTSIGGSAFTGCSGLTSITIPESVTSIGEKAFSWCSGLTSITIPDSVTSIGDEAFSFCGSLTSVTIGNSVTSIGNSAFRECSGLRSVTIGNGVTSIGDYAFYYCYNLASIKYRGTEEQWNAITKGILWDDNTVEDYTITYNYTGK